jgi:hypothetical protein
LALVGACPPGCPQGQGGGLRSEHSDERPRTVPLLHFSLGFKDSETLLAHRASVHRNEPRVGSLPPSSFLSPLPRPPRAAHVRHPFAHSRPTEADPALAVELPIPHGVPSPRYSARRTRTLHSDPKARALSPDGPGFSPVARLSSRVVLRSCFRPGTRLGLPRRPPRATLPPGARPGFFDGPGRVRRPFPAVARCRLPTRLTPKGSPHLPAGQVGVATTLFIQFSMSAG